MQGRLSPFTSSAVADTVPAVERNEVTTGAVIGAILFVLLMIGVARAVIDAAHGGYKSAPGTEQDGPYDPMDDCGVYAGGLGCVP